MRFFTKLDQLIGVLQEGKHGFGDPAVSVPLEEEDTGDEPGDR